VSWLGASRTASGGLLRHKVQAVVLGMVLLVSTASATLGFALLAATNAPFTHAFGAQHGADVTVTVNAARTSSARLAATGHLSGVTAAAGPFALATVQLQSGGQPFGQLVLAGRASPGAVVDDLVLNAGHWPDGPGQVVLNVSQGPGQGYGGTPIGSTLSVTTVLMTTRDRVHDLGIFKALGMRPGQLLTMVVCWIAGPAVIAAVIAAPAAVALNTATLRAMAGTAHTGIPASFTQVYPPSRLALLSLAALAIAAAGALLPAGWAARGRPATALRAE
jgi:hypothetical protein